jgi:Ca-activated chloride channel family protein
LSGSLKAAADRCAAEDITIISLALGSGEGGPVPDQEETVISRRDFALMRMAAERSGGICIDGNKKDAAFQLAAEIRSLAPETETRGRHREKKQQWPLFIIAALAAYGVSKLCLFWPSSFRLVFALLLFSLSACSPVKLLIIEANFFSSRGLHSRAVSSYLKALAYEEAEPYAEYGLGSAYYSLDETAPALARFEDSRRALESRPPAEHTELRYRLSYNTGVALFGQGDFEAAAHSFREALKADHGRIEAKRNLELSLLSLARRNSAGEKTETEKKETEAQVVLFEYLGQKERNQWKSREWTPEEEEAGPDY